MFGRNFRPVRPGKSIAPQVRELQKSTVAARYQRPGSGFRAVSAPFGTSSMSSTTNDFSAFTIGPISAATIDSNNVTTLGTGSVYLTWPNIDDSGVITFVPDTSRSIPVYNLSQQPVAATGDVNVIISRLHGFILYVSWEDCLVTQQ